MVDRKKINAELQAEGADPWPKLEASTSLELQLNLKGATTGRTCSDRPNESNPPRIVMDIDYAELERSTLERLKNHNVRVDQGLVKSLRRDSRDPEEQRMDAQDTPAGDEP